MTISDLVNGEKKKRLLVVEGHRSKAGFTTSPLAVGCGYLIWE